MPFSFKLPPRSERLEILDLRPATREEIDANFAEIANVNRFLGGTAAVRDGLLTLLTEHSSVPPDPLTILDVAAGGADIARALIGDARRGRFGVSLRIIATDINPEILAHARRSTPRDAFPEITVEAADALHLPYADKSVDIAVCSMAFHHFDFGACVALMREMARVSRLGFVVNDLRRDRIARALIWTLTRILRSHWITRHDAPLSVMRAYTLDEFRAMGAAAALDGRTTVRFAPMYRLITVFRRSPETSVSREQVESPQAPNL